MIDFVTGTIIAGRYRLTEMFTGGEVVAVWKGVDTRTNNEPVVLKLFSDEKKLHPFVVQFLKTEFSQSRSWKHPHLLHPKLFDFYESVPFIVMPYMKRGALREQIANRPNGSRMSETEIVDLVRQIAGAISYLHMHNLVHQDISPGNVLIGDNGEYLLSDFGLNRILYNTIVESEGASPILHPAYASPQLFEGQTATLADDIFSLGVILYQLAECNLPWGDVGGQALLQPRIDVPVIMAPYSSALRLMIYKCLQRSPEERPTALQLVQWAKTYDAQKIAASESLQLEELRKTVEVSRRKMDSELKRRAELEAEKKENALRNAPDFKTHDATRLRLEEDVRDKERRNQKAQEDLRRRLLEEEQRRQAMEQERKKEQSGSKASEGETRRQIEEEVRRKTEAEVRRKLEEEARLKAELEQKRKSEEEIRIKAEQELRRKAEEEERAKRDSETRRRIETELRQKLEEEARLRMEQETQRRLQEEKRRSEEEEARRRVEEESRRRKERDSQRQAEEEKRRAAEEMARKKEAEEEARRKEVEQDLQRKAAGEELHRKAIAAQKEAEETLRKAQEEARRIAEEERKKIDEAKIRREAEEAERRKADVEARRKAEEETRRKADELLREKEREAQQKAEETLRKAQEEARRIAEEQAKKIAEQQSRLRAEEEARRRKEEEAHRRTEELLRAKEREAEKKAEETLRKAQEEARRIAEEEARKIAEESSRKITEEQARRKSEEMRAKAEESLRRAQEEARKIAEEEARRKSEEVHAKAEESLRRAQEEARRIAEEQARKVAEEEARRRADETLRRIEEEVRLRVEQGLRAKEEAEAARRVEEDLERERRREEERKRLEAEEERRREDQAALRRMEEELRKKFEEEFRNREEIERRLKDEEENRRRSEQEARRSHDEETRREAVEEARRRAAEEARKRLEDSLNKIEDAVRRRLEEVLLTKTQEEAQRKAEEDARREEERIRLEVELDARRREQERLRAEADERQKQIEEETRRRLEEEYAMRALDEARRRAEEEVRLEAERDLKGKIELELRTRREQELRIEEELERRRNTLEFEKNNQLLQSLNDLVRNVDLNAVPEPDIAAEAATAANDERPADPFAPAPRVRHAAPDRPPAGISGTGPGKPMDLPKPLPSRRKKLIGRLSAVAIFSIALYFYLRPTIGEAVPETVLMIRVPATIDQTLIPDLYNAFLQARKAGGVKSESPSEGNLRVSALLPGVEKPVRLEVAPSGAGTAFEALAESRNDAVLTFRRLGKEEREQLQRMGANIPISEEQVVGLSGLAVIVHPDNPLRSIETDAVRRILLGEISSWKRRKTTGDGIRIYLPLQTQDEYPNIEALIGPVDAARATVIFKPSDSISVATLADPQALGIVDRRYAAPAKILSLVSGGGEARFPVAEEIAQENYSFSTRLYMYATDRLKNPIARAFMEFVQSDDGQAIVKRHGFIDQSVASIARTLPENAPPEYAQNTRGARKLSFELRNRIGSTAFDSKAQRDILRLKTYLDEPQNHAKELLVLGFSNQLGSAASEELVASTMVKKAVEKMREQGITPALMRGLGAVSLVSEDVTEEGKSRNRRVELWIR